MPRYVAEHVHPPERCPAAQPQSAAFLLQHLSDEEAKKHGVRIEADVVAQGKHHLYLIVVAPSEEVVRAYLAPFAQAGSVDVHAVSSCEEVVRRGHC